MPVLRRSIVNSLARHVEAGDNTIEEVFVVRDTGELCATYEEYLGRITLYYQPVWTCRLTGHTGMTYFEALQSEAEARRSLEDFPEWWKPYVLIMTHCSTDALEVVANRICNYCKSHLALNEPVNMEFNERLYKGIVSGAPPLREDDHEDNEHEADNCPPYKIVINDGETIISGACQTPNDVISVATRYGHAGMPWLVTDELVRKFDIKKKLDPEIAEKIKHLQQLRNEREKAIKPRQILLDKGIKIEEEVLKFPILDEFVPVGKQTDPSIWPIPKEFNTSLSIFSESLFVELMENWHFIQAFGVNLETTPMSLSFFVSSLEHNQDHNPILEAITMGIINQLSRAIKSNKAREEKIEAYLGVDDQPNYGRCFIRKRPGDSMESIPLYDSDIEEFVNEQTLSIRKEPKPWHIQLLNVLWDLRSIPEVNSILVAMTTRQQTIYQLSGSQKLRILEILKNLYLTATSLKVFVDQEIEAEAEIKHSIREAENESRRLAKYGQDLLSQQNTLINQLEDENVMIPIVKRLKREIKKLDEDINKAKKSEAAINKKLDTLRKRQFDHAAVRVRLLGEDRFHRKYWWFDLHLKRTDIKAGGSGIVLVEETSGRWSFYDEIEKIDRLVEFLNPLGCREARLGATISELRDRIGESLLSFPHVESIPQSGIEMNEQSDGEDEISTIRRRLGIKKPRVSDVPDFLRYRNAFDDASSQAIRPSFSPDFVFPSPMTFEPLFLFFQIYMALVLISYFTTWIKTYVHQLEDPGHGRFLLNRVDQDLEDNQGSSANHNNEDNREEEKWGTSSSSLYD